MLLNAEADVSSPGNDGYSPLHIAAGAGHEAVVRVLLGAGADMSLQVEYSGVTALDEAVRGGHETAARLLA